MLPATLTLLESWLPLLAGLSPPFVFALLAALAQQRWQARLDARPTPAPEPTGDWTQALAARAGLPVDVGQHPDRGAGADGYWPGVDFIALSQRTWRRADALGWAIGAHELGHAANMAAHPWAPTILPMARVVEVQAAQAAGALLVVGALIGSPAAMLAGAVLGGGALLAGGVVLVDEALASRRGMAWIAADGRLGSEGAMQARRSMWGAFGVYGAQTAGRALTLLAWPWVVGAALAAPPQVPAWLAAPGWWWLVVCAPLLLLRAAQVLDGLLRPQQVASDFRLVSVTNLDAQWEFLTAMSVATLVLVAHGESQAPAFHVALTLAAIPAMGPVGALGRLPVLVPVLLGLHLLDRGSSARLADRLGAEERVPGGAPVPAPVLDLHNRPPAWWRALVVVKLAFLPLLVGLLALALR